MCTSAFPCVLGNLQRSLHMTGGLDSNSLLCHMRLHVFARIAAHPSMLTGLRGGRRAYQALTWLGVNPSVPRLGLTSPIQEFQG